MWYHILHQRKKRCQNPFSHWGPGFKYQRYRCPFFTRWIFFTRPDPTALQNTPGCGGLSKNCDESFSRHSMTHLSLNSILLTYPRVSLVCRRIQALQNNFVSISRNREEACNTLPTINFVTWRDLSTSDDELSASNDEMSASNNML